MTERICKCVERNKSWIKSLKQKLLLLTYQIAILEARISQVENIMLIFQSKRVQVSAHKNVESRVHLLGFSTYSDSGFVDIEIGMWWIEFHVCFGLRVES